MQLILGLIFVFMFYPITALAEILLVNQIQGGLFVSSAPTVTYVYRSQNPKRTILYISGGNGSVGVEPDWGDHKYFTEYSFNMFLKRFAEKRNTSGSSNVVVFDNPTSLDQGNSFYPTPRGRIDHLIRIHSVVNYYAALFNKPVWILGHSNGGASAAEYLKWLYKENKEIDIKGIVFASGADGTIFPSETKIPVLFVHHENDGCVPYITHTYSKKYMIN
jgi:pimeloyl-ACP methyl ester carboxylesterase